MAKRKAGSDEGSPHSKRKKLTQSSKAHQETHEPPKAINAAINSAEDLRTLLIPEEVDANLLLQRTRAFKSYLDAIAHESGSKELSTKSATLLAYLRTQISLDDEDTPKVVPDIIKIGHHAGEINSENLFSSTASVLAVLLKTISGLHEFRDVGNALCRILLHSHHIKLIEHGMSAVKTKEHLISPCLRLLKEIVQFDGGRAAKTVYRLRHITFQRFDVFLSLRGRLDDEERKGNRKRQSVRNTAISYLLVNFRLQIQTAKCYILAQSRWTRSLLSDLGSDPPGLVLGITETLKRDVMQDKALPLSVKGRFFDDWVLGRLATLYVYKDGGTIENGGANIPDAVHELLQTVCASSEYGLLTTLGNEQSADAEATDEANSSDEDEGANATSKDLLKMERSVFRFLQSLRPHASVLQSDLLLACFRTSSHVLTQYFAGKATFSFEPKLTATWVGYAQLLLAIIQQPLSEEVVQSSLSGNKASMEDLVNCILPPPLTQKILMRCLNQASGLVTFFTVQILVAAFRKLRTARRMIRSGSCVNQGNAEPRLTSIICGRCPKMKEVIPQFKNCGEQNMMLRESILRLMALYYTEAPQLALEENFDVSPALSVALANYNAKRESIDKDGMRLLELDHLIQIASQSPNVKWWHKPDSKPLSPFTMLLKNYVQGKEQEANALLKPILKSIAEENSITWPAQPASGFDAFVLSLRFQRTKHEDEIYAFLDNCFMRLVKKTVIYSEMLDDLMANSENETELKDVKPDILMVTLMEQIPHLVEKSSPLIVAAVAHFLRVYIDFSSLRGVNKGLLGVREKLKESLSKQRESHVLIEKALQQPMDSSIKAAFELHQTATSNLLKVAPTPQPLEGQLLPEVVLPPGPPAEDENHRGLIRWTREDIQDAVADGAVEELLLCLCSEHGDIRKQGLTGVRSFMEKLEASGYSEWQQTHVLFGEVAETASGIGLESRLPYFAGVLAARLLTILADPLHSMYEKANVFLNKGPQWTVEKLPSYWTDKILLHPPTDDDSHFHEVEWLLNLLIDGLRTPKDMDLYRHCHIFERLLTLAASPKLPAEIFEKIIDLLFRCTYVGGSTTLISRCGLMAWVSMYINLPEKGNTKGLLTSKLRNLGVRAYETSDKARVDDWSNGSLASVVDSFRGPRSK